MTQFAPRSAEDAEPQGAAIVFSEKSFFAHDWSATPLGAESGWDPQLRSWVMFMLTSAQPMFIIWGNARVFLFNDAFRPILGGHYLEALGASLPHLWEDRWTDVGDLLDDAFAGRTGVVEERKLLTWASDFNEARWFTFSYSPIHNPAREVVGAVCLLADTTATVQSKDKLRRERDALYALFQQAPSFMAMLQGPEHRFTFANAAYHQIVGRTEVTGLMVSEVLPEIVAQSISEILDKVYESGDAFIAHDLEQGLDISGERIYVEVIYQPVTDPGGIVTGVLIVGQNVSERHYGQERIAALQNELTQASQMNAMATMASTLAHELNQPLTVIHSYMSAAGAIAGRQTVDPLLVKCFKESQDAALRAGEIIRRLRDLTANGYIKKETIDLTSAVTDAVDLILAGQGAIKVTLAFGPGAALVAGDRIQVQQVLFNLLRNASESSGGERCAVTVATRDLGLLVEVCVSDAGPGIPDNLLPTIFEPFRTTKPDGMGVGLSICKTIIEAHGGTIHAKNNLGGGASVCFTLDHA